MNEKNPAVIFRAQFHPLIKTYLFLYSLGVLLISLIGIVLIPFWILGIGFYACKRYFERLECVLTERTLEFKKGYFIRVEKTIPLDKIQDLTLKTGPLLRAFGLTRLDVQTAGQSAQEGAEAKLIGIVDVTTLRGMVLSQRDKLVAGSLDSSDNFVSKQFSNEQSLLLQEIRDTLQRMEKLLQK